MKKFILDLLGYDPEELEVIRNAYNNIKAQLDTRDHTISSLRNLLTEHKENNAKLYAYNKELESLNKKFCNEIQMLQEEKKVLSEGLMIQKRKYDEQNKTIDEIIGPWRKKLAQTQGRLGAYIKKYGDLPHRRENDRNRKKAPVSGASAPDKTPPANETPQNPTAN